MRDAVMMRCLFNNSFCMKEKEKAPLMAYDPSNNEVESAGTHENSHAEKIVAAKKI